MYSEIAELMAVKSKFGSGGEFNPEWMPWCLVDKLSQDEQPGLPGGCLDQPAHTPPTF